MAKQASANGQKPLSKSEIMTQLAERTGLSKKQLSGFFDELSGLIQENLKDSGVFNVPGLVRIKSIHKPATPARKGKNPFTGEEQMFKAKAARNVVKVQPLKRLKEMA